MTALRSPHTPGPWEYRPVDIDDWGIVRAPSEQGHFYGGIICQAFDPDARDNVTLAIHREAGTDPWEANARLIAAAPELLEALQEAAAMFRHYERLHMEKGTLDGDAKARRNAEMAEKCEAALAKATGAP